MLALFTGTIVMTGGSLGSSCPGSRLPSLMTTRSLISSAGRRLPYAVSVRPFAFDRPGHFLVSEIFRYAHPENPSLPPRHKVRGLPGVAGPPKSTLLSGPGGIASSSFQFRLKYPKTRSNVPSGFRIQPSKYGTTS